MQSFYDADYMKLNVSGIEVGIKGGRLGQANHSGSESLTFVCILELFLDILHHKFSYYGNRCKDSNYPSPQVFYMRW